MSETYNITFAKSAAKFFLKQPKVQQKRIASAIFKLPRGNTRKLKDYDDLYRLRVGDYRVIYTVKYSENVIAVLKIDNRGDVYKKV